MTNWTVSDAYSKQKSDLMALELEKGLYEALHGETRIARAIQEERQKLVETHGLFIPAIRIKTVTADEKVYTIFVRGQRVGQAVLHPPLTFSAAAEDGIPGVHPVTQEPGFWGENGGASAHELLLHHLRTVMEAKAPLLLTYETAARWLHQARTHVPTLVKELEKRGVTTGLIWQVMRKLLDQRIPLHPFEDLLETVMEYYIVHPPAGHTPPEWSQSHPDDIVKYISAQKKSRLPRPGQTSAAIHHLKR